jgi:hypothetical protein
VMITFVPIFYILLSLITKLIPQPSLQVSTDLTFALLWQPQHIAFTNTVGKDQFTSDFVERFVEGLETSQWRDHVILQEMTSPSELITYLREDQAEGGIFFNKTFVDQQMGLHVYNFTIVDNQSNQNLVPVLFNLISNGISMTFQRDFPDKIPLQLTSNPFFFKKEELSLLGIVFVYLLGMTIIGGVATSSAILVKQQVQDKKKKLKFQILSNGVSHHTYWISIFLSGKRAFQFALNLVDGFFCRFSVVASRNVVDNDTVFGVSIGGVFGNELHRSYAVAAHVSLIYHCIQPMDWFAV